MADGLQVGPQDRDLIVRTILGEAGGQNPEGMAGVANVIANRLASGKYGKTGADVVLAPNQFEPWTNRGSELLGYDPQSPAYQNAGAILDGVLSGKTADNTGGATHFYAPQLQSQLGRPAPVWAQGQGKLIAGQMYYAPQGPVSRASSAPASKAIDAMTQPSKGAAPPPVPADVLRKWNMVDDDDASAPSAPANTAVAAAAPSTQPPPVPADVLKRWNMTDDEPAKAADVVPQAAGKPASVDPQTGYTVSKNDQGYTSLTDPKTGRIMQQFAPGDYEGRASQLGSFVGGVANGVPIAGPAIVGGVESAAAASRAISNNTPYQDELAKVQGLVAGDQAAYPKTNIAGNLTGAGLTYAAAGAIPGANALLGGGAGGLGSRILLGTGSNGLIGGTDSHARGDSPLWGGVFGAGGGAAGPAAGKVVGNAVGAGLNKLTTLMPSTIPGVDRPAANMLARLVTADDPNAVRTSLGQLGPLGMLADAGPSLQGITTGLSSKPGEARSAISDALTQRGAGRDSRLLGDIDTALGPAESPQAVGDNILAHRGMTDAANYAVVHAQQTPVDVSNVVKSIDAALPTAVGSQRTALNSIRSELVSSPATYDDFGKVATPEAYHDNSELLHNLRQEIDKSINYGDPGLGVPQGAVQRANGSLVMVRGALDDALKSQVPGMAEADAASSALVKRAEAVQSGTNLLDSGKSTVTPSDFADQRATMDPGEAIAQNKGLRGEIDRLVGTKRNDLVALQGALQGEGGWNTQKLGTAFGEEPTNLLTGAVTRESRFAGTEGEALKGSRTERSAAARQELEESDPTRVNLSGVTPLGLVLQGAKSGVVNPLLDALLSQDSTARNGQLANALVAQGPARDAIVNRLVPFAARQNALSAGATSVGGLSDALTNLLTRTTSPSVARRYARQLGYGG